MRFPLLHRSILATLATLGISTLASAANAPDDLSLEALLDTPVTSASKRPQKPTDAPSMVSVISAEEIRRFGWRTVGEALASLGGVQVSYDRSYTYLGVRGFARPGDYNARMLMLVDGMPINDGVYDQAPVGSEFPIDMALVERIEYVPGPGSVLYGGNAFFGVINVVTSSGARHGSDVAIGMGPGGLWEARATLGQRGPYGGDWLLSASRQRQRGADLHFEPYALPGANAVSHGLDWETNDRMFLRYERGGFGSGLLAHERRKGAPGGPYGADLDDPRNRQGDRRVQGWLRYEQYLSTDWQLILSGWAGQSRYQGQWAYGGEVDTDEFEVNSRGGEAKLISTAMAGHIWVAGISLRLDSKRRQFNRFMDTNIGRRTRGIFIQDDWRIQDNLTLSLGLRHDTYSGNRTHLSPRLALIAQPGPRTTLKLIAGSAFRPANAYETDYVYEGTNLPNPNLEAERIHSRELGFEHRFTPESRLTASLYHNHIHDLITPILDPLSGALQHQNVGAITTQGLEIGAGTHLGIWSLRGSVSWQQSRHESGAELANTPRQLAKFLVSAPLADKTTVAWETHFTGRRRAENGDISSDAPFVGGHAVSHATLTGRLAGAEWQVRLANVFNRRYGDVIGTEFSTNWPGSMATPMPTMQQDGRGLFLRLRWEL